MQARRRAGALLVFSLVASMPALAQVAAPGAASPAQAAELPTDEVALVRQDFSDCTNSDVTANDPSLIGGTVWVVRNPDGNTAVKVAITATPNTTYHFNLKCSGRLGDITTEDEGQGVATFNFLTSSMGPVYAFDMFPEGAPSGSGYQSVKVEFR